MQRLQRIRIDVSAICYAYLGEHTFSDSVVLLWIQSYRQRVPQ